MKTLRTASLGSNFTGSYKKKRVYKQYRLSINFYHIRSIKVKDQMNVH